MRLFSFTKYISLLTFLKASMLVAVLFLIGVKLLLLLYKDEMPAISPTGKLHTLKPGGVLDELPPPDSNYYIVREHWDFQHPQDAMDNIFYYPLKVFQRESEGESLKAAERYYEERLKVIALRKMLFCSLDRVAFTITLSCLKIDSNSEASEDVITTTNQNNLPIHEDLKNGLYLVKTFF
jgi:hypothetical protein